MFTIFVQHVSMLTPVIWLIDTMSSNVQLLNTASGKTEMLMVALDEKRITEVFIYILEGT